MRCLLETLSKSHDHQQPLGLRNSSDVTLPHQNSPTEPPDTKRACPNPPSLTPSPPHSHPHSSPSPSRKLRAIVIALCCHHRCSWSQLAGTAWLCGCGFSPTDVHLITKMSSWAVCGVRGTGKEDFESRDLEHEHSPYDNSATVNSDDVVITSSTHPISTMATSSTHSPSTTMTSSAHHDRPRSYHPHPREATGIMCKRVLDLARLSYLRDNGMDGRLVYFVSRATSLENVLLIATPSTLVLES